MKTNLLQKIFLGVALAVLTVSCLARPTPENKPSQDDLSSVPTLALTPAHFPTGPASPVSATQTSFPRTNVRIEQTCTLIESPDLPFAQSSIVLFDANNNVSLLNLKTGSRISLGQIVILSGALSNGQELAYIDANSHKVIVVNPDGDERVSIPAADNWFEILDWLDNDNILVGSMPLTNAGTWYPPSDTIVLNLSSAAQTEIRPNYPNIYNYVMKAPHFGRYSYSVTAYDPTLSYVVYPYMTNRDEGIVLWDIKNNRQIAQLGAFYPWNAPAWNHRGASFVISLQPKYTSSDGRLIHKNTTEEFPYVGGSELFNVDIGGKISRLTYLTTRYMAEEQSYVWSQDDKFIAFWLKNENEEWDLATLDVETGEIRAYCVGDEYGSYSIFWSPDGNQLISTIENSDGERKIVFIDFQDNRTILVPNAEIVIGWLTNSR